jgi:hypothetical protein
MRKKTNKDYGTVAIHKPALKQLRRYCKQNNLYIWEFVEKALTEAITNSKILEFKGEFDPNKDYKVGDIVTVTKMPAEPVKGIYAPGDYIKENGKFVALSIRATEKENKQ